MIILSLDPGVERTGFAILDKQEASKFTFITAGIIQTSKKVSLEVRLLQIYTDLVSLVKKFSPKVLVLERVFFFKNQKTVIQVAQAQGVSLLIASQYKIPVVFFTPLQIKQIITGYGNADKRAVQKMLLLLLGNQQGILQDDTADAIACGLSYCYWNKNIAS